MKIFAALYQRVIFWSKHRHAPYYLGFMSFIESSFFPIPPDVMLVPMVLAQPKKAFHYAFITTIASVLGGLFGYAIGMFAFEWIYPLFIKMGYGSMYHQISDWFQRWNFWIIFAAGFTPIPYKLFTVAAGAANISLLPFLLGSVIGRGARFFLVAWLMSRGGERMEIMIMRYIDRITWILIAIAILLGLWWYYSGW